jgi:hypothetical protein
MAEQKLSSLRDRIRPNEICFAFHRAGIPPRLNKVTLFNWAGGTSRIYPGEIIFKFHRAELRKKLRKKILYNSEFFIQY